MPRVYTQQGDTVDLLCWRHFGRTDKVVEAVLELNPGLADHGEILPLGLIVELPEAPKDQPTATTIRLWE